MTGFNETANGMLQRQTKKRTLLLLADCCVEMRKRHFGHSSDGTWERGRAGDPSIWLAMLLVYEMEMNGMHNAEFPIFPFTSYMCNISPDPQEYHHREREKGHLVRFEFELVL
jgi:hypothetical protein